MFRAACPSGASTGIYEAVELRDKEARCHGKGVTKAVANVNDIIGPALIGKDPTKQSEIDEQMQLVDARLRKAALDIGRCIEDEERDKETDKQIIELEACLLEATGEIEHRLQVLERGLPASARKVEASGLEG